MKLHIIPDFGRTISIDIDHNTCLQNILDDDRLRMFASPEYEFKYAQRSLFLDNDHGQNLLEILRLTGVPIRKTECTIRIAKTLRHGLVWHNSDTVEFISAVDYLEEIIEDIYEL